MFTTRLMEAVIVSYTNLAFMLVYLRSCRQETFLAPDVCLQGTIKQWLFVDRQRQDVQYPFWKIHIARSLH